MPYTYTVNEYDDMVKCYHAQEGNGAAARRQYHELYPDRKLPYPETFMGAAQRLRESGKLVRPNVDAGRPSGVKRRSVRSYAKRKLDKEEECYAEGTLGDLIGDEIDRLAIKVEPPSEQDQYSSSIIQADSSHASSSRQSNTSTSQHTRAATRRTSSRATNDDDGAGTDMNVNKAISEATTVSLSSVKKVLSLSRSSQDIEDVIKSPIKRKKRNPKIEVDSFTEDDAELFGDSNDGSMDAIKPSTKTETSTKIKTSTKTEMTTKTKPTTNTKSTTKTKTTIAISSAEISVDEVFSCDVCSGSIVGFRYVCVQCAHYTLCASCESRGEHSLHYVLRIPRLAKKAEVDAILSKIRTHLLYGLETEEAEQETDDRVVPALPEEFEIKAEIKEELPDPLEHEDAFRPEDVCFTEPEYIAREKKNLPKEKTITPAPVNTLSMILTETEGNYVIIENPVKSKATKTKPKTTKHKNTSKPEHNGSEKRMKIYLEDQTRASETLMDVPVVTAGPSTEGASGLLPDIVKTEEQGEDSFQVFSQSPHEILESKPGPDTGMTKSKAKGTSKKKVL